MLAANIIQYHDKRHFLRFAKRFRRQAVHLGYGFLFSIHLISILAVRG